MTQQLSRDDVAAAFQELGEALARARKVVEVAVNGGAPILLQFDVNFRTGDVDATVESGDHGALLQAVQDIADRRQWLRSWFSEAVSVYVSDVDATMFHRSYPSETRVGLRVYVAKPDYLLAMKLRAMRIGSRDEADATLLARASGMTSYVAMVDLLTHYFPKEPAAPRQLALVAQFAETLDAPPAH